MANMKYSTMGTRPTSNAHKNGKRVRLIMRLMYQRRKMNVCVVTREVQFKLINRLHNLPSWKMFKHISQFEAKVQLEDIMLKYKHSDEDLPIGTVKLIKSALKYTLCNHSL